MKNNKLQTCPTCKGKGIVIAEYSFRISDFGKNQFENVKEEEICENCDGKGKVKSNG